MSSNFAWKRLGLHFAVRGRPEHLRGHRLPRRPKNGRRSYQLALWKTTIHFMRNILITQQARLTLSDTPSQTMIDDHSGIQQLVCRPGQGMCNTFDFIAIASFSCVVSSSASESKNVANSLFCRSRRFSWAASDVITEITLAIQARKTPPLRPLPTSYTSFQDPPALSPFVSQHLKLQHTLMSASRPADLIINETLRIT